jgi:hypothetical protein
MSDAGTYEGGVETSLVATRGRWKGEFPPQGEHDDAYHNLWKPGQPPNEELQKAAESTQSSEGEKRELDDWLCETGIAVQILFTPR